MTDYEIEARRERLSAPKKAFLEKIKQKKNVEQWPSGHIPARSQPTSNAVLSFAQQRLWFMQQFDIQATNYNVSIPVRLKGNLEIKALEHCLAEIIQRHEILRTTFVIEQDQPRQRISSASTIRLQLIDLTMLLGTMREDEARTRIKEALQQPFDLENGPLLRILLFQIGAQDHILVICLHHIIADGWSIEVLAQELSTLYEAFVSGNPALLPPLPVQYADYACWQREWLQESLLQPQLAYWRHQLHDAPALLALPIDHPRPAFQTSCGASCSVLFPFSLLRELRQLSKQHGTTVFMTLLTAFQVLLMRYSGQEDILVGTPIANRTRPEFEPLIGCFLNVLVLRTRLAGNPTFQALLMRVRNDCLDAYANQDIPFEYLVDALLPTRDPSYSPLFQVMFVLHNTTMQNLTLSGITSEAFDVDTLSTAFDLTLNMVETEQGLMSTFEYNTDLFNQTTIERMQRHLQTLLESIVQDSAQPIATMPLLKPAEIEEILFTWNTNQKAYESCNAVPQLFAAQAERTPDAFAIISTAEKITYGTLQQRVNQLARYLCSLGVVRETPIGIYLDQSIDMVVSLLAIQSVGGVYLPLAPRYPRERLAFMLADSQTSLVITQQDLSKQLADLAGRMICLDQEQENLAAYSGDFSPELPLPDQLAYIIYTSGSTGKPKGVQVTHHALTNFLFSMDDSLHLGAQDLLLSVTPLSFDIAGLELYLPLLGGACLLLASRDEALDGRMLVNLLDNYPVTLMQATPATWRMLLTADWKGKIGLTILCGGEALPLDLMRQLRTKGAACWNLYGPTETTIWSIADLVRPDDNQVFIGHPIANTQVYVLDEYRQPVPPGVAGELYIGGAGLARGYLKRPELTAACFVPDPFSSRPGARLYRTGDIVRHATAGKLEYLYRRDTQVKVRGFRIELTEVEYAIRQYDLIQDATVVVCDDLTGDKKLIAYIVPTAASILTEKGIRDFLRQILPLYALPEMYIFLQALPLTTNGKVDRRALPPPRFPEIDAEGQSSRAVHLTLIQEVIVDIYVQLLKKPIDLQTNFFEAGGNSLQAAQLAARIRQTLQVDLPMRLFFESPTVAECSRFVEDRLCEQKLFHLPPLLPLSREHRTFPLSLAQQRLWFLEQLYPGSASYNMPLALRIRGKLNEDALQKSLQEIIRRHEILRTTFAIKNEQPVQVIAAPLFFPLLKEDLRAIPDAERTVAVSQRVTSAVRMPFDLVRGPLLRAKLWKLDTHDSILLLNFHHSIFDGWSMGIFGQELALLYQSYEQGRPSPLPDLPIQYVDYAVWQRQWLQGEVLAQLVHNWRQQLADLPALKLSRGKAGGIQTDVGKQLLFSFPADLSEQLRRLSRQEGATLFMTLLATFALLLYEFTGQNDFAIGTDFANRSHVDTENLIGFFANQLLLRMRIEKSITFRQFLTHVRETTLNAYANQDLPFDKLVEALRPERQYGQNPLLQVKFVFQNTPASAINIAGLECDPFDVQTGSAKFDLLCNVMDEEEGIQGYWEYRAHLLDEPTASALFMQYTEIAEIICAQPDLTLFEITSQLAERRIYQQAIHAQEIRQMSLKKMRQLQQRTRIHYKEGKHHE